MNREIYMSETTFVSKLITSEVNKLLESAGRLGSKGVTLDPKRSRHNNIDTSRIQIPFIASDLYQMCLGVQRRALSVAYHVAKLSRKGET